MLLLQVEKEYLYDVFQQAESGMDFAIVSGEVTDFDNEIEFQGALVVRGNGYAAPVEKQEGIYSLVDMFEGLPIPDYHDGRNVKLIALRNFHPVASLLSTSLPPNYLRARGAHQLLGSLTLSYNTRVFRFTSDPADVKFDATSNSLKAGAYLTTFNDQQFVNTGFGAVGRYALPLPIPASFVHDYTLPVGTTLQVGTVAPQFGQAGGGVEVKTVSTVTNVVKNYSGKIDDC